MPETDTDSDVVQHDPDRPFYRQTWFTHIVAPLTVLMISGFVAQFFTVWMQTAAAQRKAEDAKTMAEQNAAKIKQQAKERKEDQKARRQFERDVIETLGNLESDVSNVDSKLDKLSEDLQRHRQNHHDGDRRSR
ncbi:MAG: hypothetical protein ABEN55_12050 [Bradymonadaceae bacterium]